MDSQRPSVVPHLRTQTHNFYLWQRLAERKAPRKLKECAGCSALELHKMTASLPKRSAFLVGKLCLEVQVETRFELLLLREE